MKITGQITEMCPKIFSQTKKSIGMAIFMGFQKFPNIFEWKFGIYFTTCSQLS
jgi:hypothetical protein